MTKEKQIRKTFSKLLVEDYYGVLEDLYEIWKVIPEHDFYDILQGEITPTEAYYYKIISKLMDDILGPNKQTCREVTTGKIKNNKIHRGIHPISYKGEKYEIISFLKEKKVETIINLSDDNSSLESRMHLSSFYKEVYKKGNIALLNLDTDCDIASNDCIEKIIEGLKFMINHKPPYYIHCEYGKERTGLFMLLIESLLDSTISEIIFDYSSSFFEKIENFNINRLNFIIRVTIVFMKMKNNILYRDDNLNDIVSSYLTTYSKISIEEINALRKILSDK